MLTCTFILTKRTDRIFMVYLNWQDHYDKREDVNLWASLLFSEDWCAWLASLGSNWYWWPNEWWLWCLSHQWNMQELLELPSKIYYLSFVWFSSSPSDDWYFQVALTSDQSLSPSWIGGHFNSLPGNSHSMSMHFLCIGIHPSFWTQNARNSSFSWSWWLQGGK